MLVALFSWGRLWRDPNDPTELNPISIKLLIKLLNFFNNKSRFSCVLLSKFEIDFLIKFNKYVKSRF